MADPSIEDQVKEYLKEGHGHEAIRDHLRGKGMHGEAVEVALQAAGPANLKKHPFTHYAIFALIILGILAIVALFVIFGFRGQAKLSPSVSALLADIDAAAASGDGGAYFSLMSPAQRNDACQRWQAARDTFGPDGSSCLEAMETFYSSRLRSFFGGENAGLKVLASTENDAFTTLMVRAGGREFRIILEEAGGRHYLASDFLLDASITEVIP